MNHEDGYEGDMEEDVNLMPPPHPPGYQYINNIVIKIQSQSYNTYVMRFCHTNPFHIDFEFRYNTIC